MRHVIDLIPADVRAAMQTVEDFLAKTSEDVVTRKMGVPEAAKLVGAMEVFAVTVYQKNDAIFQIVSEVDRQKDVEGGK